MSDGQSNQGTPPITKPSVAVAGGAPAQSAGVSRTALIWIGVAVVLLSFVAAFLGSWLARSTEAAAEPTPVAERRPPSTSIRPTTRRRSRRSCPPARRCERARACPQSGKGYEGERLHRPRDVRCLRLQGRHVGSGRQHPRVGGREPDRSDRCHRRDGRRRAPPARPARRARPGAGAPGAPGTQVSLGSGAPDDDTCTADGDIYIDTAAWSFYQCDGGDVDAVRPRRATTRCTRARAEREHRRLTRTARHAHRPGPRCRAAARARPSRTIGGAGAGGAVGARTGTLERISDRIHGRAP